MGSRELSTEHIALMAHVEETCENRSLVPPVGVKVMDADGNTYDFEYDPEADEVQLPVLSPLLPMVLRLTDSKGTQLEQRLTTLAPLPEWSKAFRH